MDTSQIQAMIDASIQANAVKNQYTNSPIPYHLHNGIDSPFVDMPASSSDSPVFWQNAFSVVGAGVTLYFTSFGAGTPESGAQVPSPSAGTISNLYVLTSGTQPGTGDLNCTFRVNSTDTAIRIRVPAGAGEGFYSDLSNSATVNAGDFIDVKVTNAASSNTPAVVCFFFNFK